MTNEKNKKVMGNYMRNIITLIENNIMNLEQDKIKYGRFQRFVRGISLNIAIRKRQLEQKKRKLQRYIDDGRAI